MVCYVGAGDATENESPARSSGCWSTQAEVDPLWHLSRWSSNGSVHGQNGNASRWTALPELEPMRSEMRPPAGGRDANGRRSMTVAPATPAIKSTISFGATARLPCPVRQLGNRTVRIIRSKPGPPLMKLQRQRLVVISIRAEPHWMRCVSISDRRLGTSLASSLILDELLPTQIRS